MFTELKFNLTEVLRPLGAPVHIGLAGDWAGMLGALQRRGWRGAIGLIAASALVLQAFFAVSMATQALVLAGQQGGEQAGSYFVICTEQDGMTALDGAGAPARPMVHCPNCTLASSGAATLPDPVALTVPQAVSAERTPFVSVAACISFHQARAGLSRAPPQNA